MNTGLISLFMVLLLVGSPLAEMMNTNDFYDNTNIIDTVQFYKIATGVNGMRIISDLLADGHGIRKSQCVARTLQQSLTQCGIINGVARGCCPGFYCSWGDGVCGGVNMTVIGVCLQKPTTCPTSNCTSPRVCGCDGVLYCSQCNAFQSGSDYSAASRCALNATAGASSISSFLDITGGNMQQNMFSVVWKAFMVLMLSVSLIL
jgi:hypothetical protein